MGDLAEPRTQRPWTWGHQEKRDVLLQVRGREGRFATVHHALSKKLLAQASL